MTKEDFVKVIAEKAEMTKKQAALALNSALAAISEALKKGDKITLIGFGTFSVRQKKARTGINPRTQQKIKIPATKVPVFKPGSKLKESVKK